jgi:Spy/CpxP family protein refolding chaperone
MKLRATPARTVIMKRYSGTRRIVLASILLMLFAIGSGVFAQATQTQSQVDPNQAQAQNLRANQLPDFQFLDLTPDQIQRIRAINAELKDERRAAGTQLRQTQRALAEAVESTTPDETLIAQRSREVAAAQANTIRLRSLTEARVLQVLTPEQRTRLREMRLRNQEARRAAQQRGNGLGQQGLQRKANAPLLGPNQRRLLRRQQRP